MKLTNFTESIELKKYLHKNYGNIFLKIQNNISSIGTQLTAEKIVENIIFLFQNEKEIQQFFSYTDTEKEKILTFLKINTENNNIIKTKILSEIPKFGEKGLITYLYEYNNINEKNTYYVTIMSIDPDDKYGKLMGDDSQKYMYEIKAENKKEAEINGRLKFIKENGNLPIFWLKVSQ